MKFLDYLFPKAFPEAKEFVEKFKLSRHAIIDTSREDTLS